ncbi:MAG: hypothetical protein QG673_974 [Pseudomonadota bacterium]|nr:hypothetical protein [Pseudomonadota bacterium]
MLHIIDCKYISGYQLALTFDNGTNGIADLKDLPNEGNVFQPLKDIEVFKNIKLDHGVTTWLNGQLDIAPEYLFFLVNKDNLEYKELFTEWGYLP